MALFDILVSLKSDTASLVSGLDQAQRKIEDFTGRASSLFSSIAGFAGFGLSVAGIAHEFSSLIEAGAQLDRLAVRVGTSGQAFSELAYAAGQSGIGADQLAVALTKMDQAMSKASTGEKNSTDALHALGLTFNDLKSLSPELQLEVIADRISKLSTPADKARAEIALFGRAGAELAPLLEQGAAGIEKLRDEARGLGASFSDELLGKLKDSEEATKRLEKAFGALGTTIVGNVAPSVTSFTNAITALITDDKVGKLQAKLDFLNAGVGTQYALGGPIGLLIGQLTKAKGAAQDLHHELDLQSLVLKPEDLQGPDFSRLLGGPVPGYGNDPLAALTGVRVTAQKTDVDKMAALYDEFGKDTETGLERVANEYFKFEAELDELRKVGIISAEEYTKRQQAELDKILPGVKAEGHIKQPPKDIEESFTEMEKLGNKAAASIQGAFANFLFDPFHGGARRMAVDFLQALQKMTADAAASGIFDALFSKKGDAPGSGVDNLGGFFGSLLTGSPIGGGGGGQSTAGKVLGGIAGGLSKFIGSFFGGGAGVSNAAWSAAYSSLDASTGAVLAADAATIAGSLAGGGDVSAGGTYLVGEQGPELFTASSHGTITPNDQLGGEMNYHGGDVNIDARGADHEGLTQLRAALPAILGAHAARVKSDMLFAFRRRGLPAPPRA